MTDRCYLDDSSVRHFSATVMDVDREADPGPGIVLDRTHFYPTGGGQPHDTGVLETENDRYHVIDVVGSTTVSHHVESNRALPPVGAEITGHIDWDRRFALMRYHTAQHILSAVLLDDFGAPTAGNQLYPDRARIDCERDRFTEDELATIEHLVNEHIEVDRSVSWRIMDRTEAAKRLDPERTRLELLPDHVTEVRIVEIEDLDRTACAGTHVDSTGEIGRFTITGRETGGRGRERIRFQLD